MDLKYGPGNGGGLGSWPVRNDYFVTTNCGLLLSIADEVTTDTVPIFAPVGTIALRRQERQPSNDLKGFIETSTSSVPGAPKWLE